MHRRNARGRIVWLIGVAAITAAATLSPAVFGQGGGGGRGGGGRGGGGARGGGPPATAEASAPLDLTGYWVSLVTEDWRFRMVTPAKGDYASVPISPAGRALADQWDPDKDTAAGLQCKSYGAAGLMRVPTRLHITWADPKTRSRSKPTQEPRPVCSTSAIQRRPRAMAGCRASPWRAGTAWVDAAAEAVAVAEASAAEEAVVVVARQTRP